MRAAPSIGSACVWRRRSTSWCRPLWANSQFGANTGYFSLRLQPGVGTAIPEARRVVAGLDPSLALYEVTTMESVVGDTRAATRFYTTLLGIFSGVALLLAAIGLYGVVAYTASQRTREIGIRIALGAEADDVAGMVIRQGIRPALLGIAVGLVASWFGARMLGSLLFGVTWQDPVTLVGVVGMLLAVTGLATHPLPLPHKIHNVNLTRLKRGWSRCRRRITWANSSNSRFSLF